ncbi:flagellar biosynthesis protein FlhF [Dyella subtropica]|uniref:flagellar biosynthesis protein FlhF n=1 Tax=Dyella subtropica TaxID=2992127 RepID=UPI002252BA54|nr:flagellar biosynthesis protein FlhF [Dyella subtropica]
MKIKRFVARDMRQAMREVREEQGPDAVILSTRRFADGIEIIAAIDYDEALVREAARHGAPLTVEPAGVTTPESVPVAIKPMAIKPAETPPPARSEPGGMMSALRSLITPSAFRASENAAAVRTAHVAPERYTAPEIAPVQKVERASVEPVAAPVARKLAPVIANTIPDGVEPSAVAAHLEAVRVARERARINEEAAVSSAKAEPPVAEVPQLRTMVEQTALDTARMRTELGSLRELLESQLSSLAWNDMERRHPLRGRVLRDMTRLGIEPDVARRLADGLPEQLSADQARYLPLGVLSRSLSISAHDAAFGGVTALVGPTGVGKTTTIAKLAARAVLRHGAGQVALVSTDNYRIGAAAQLEHYGRLLGVRVFPAHDADSLREVLQVLRGRRTVLVDSAGASGNDARLQQQMALLREAGELRTCLVLAANAQAMSLDEAVRAYRPLEPQACIVTKLDEAPSLGGVLSVLIRHGLSLDYTTDGQRVPEDIAAADARTLVCRAAQVLKTVSGEPDNDMMAERFGLARAMA